MPPASETSGRWDSLRMSRTAELSTPGIPGRQTLSWQGPRS